MIKQMMIDMSSLWEAASFNHTADHQLSWQQRR